MLTMEKLRMFGADTDDGLKRCMNNETFYLMLVNKAMQDDSYDRLKQAVDAGDLERGFEIAHALKGVTGNLSLTPIRKPVTEITELLRNRADTDYSPYLDEILARRSELLALIG